jgi:hypothetical protein
VLWMFLQIEKRHVCDGDKVRPYDLGSRFGYNKAGVL